MGCGGQKPSHGEASQISLGFCRRFKPEAGLAGLQDSGDGAGPGTGVQPAHLPALPPPGPGAHSAL